MLHNLWLVESEAVEPWIWGPTGNLDVDFQRQSGGCCRSPSPHGVQESTAFFFFLHFLLNHTWNKTSPGLKKEIHQCFVSWVLHLFFSLWQACPIIFIILEEANMNWNISFSLSLFFFSFFPFLSHRQELRSAWRTYPFPMRFSLCGITCFLQSKFPARRMKRRLRTQYFNQASRSWIP